MAVGRQVTSLADKYMVYMGHPRASLKSKTAMREHRDLDWQPRKKSWSQIALIDFFVFNSSMGASTRRVRWESRMWPFPEKPSLFMDSFYAYTNDVLQDKMLNNGSAGSFQGCGLHLNPPLSMCNFRCNVTEAAICAPHLKKMGAWTARAACQQLGDAKEMAHHSKSYSNLGHLSSHTFARGFSNASSTQTRASSRGKLASSSPRVQARELKPASAR